MARVGGREGTFAFSPCLAPCLKVGKSMCMYWTVGSDVERLAEHLPQLGGGLRGLRGLRGLLGALRGCLGWTETRGTPSKNAPVETWERKASV